MRVAIILVLLVVGTLFGFSLSGNLDYRTSDIDSQLFLIPIILLSLYILFKSEIPKLKLEISSKILTVFICMILLSSVFAGVSNYATPNEVFAEEFTNSTSIDTNSTSIDTTDVISTNQTSSIDSSLDPLDETIESTTSSNSTSVDTADVISTNQTNSTDSTLDPLAETIESSTSSNSTSVDTTDVISTNLTNSTDSTLDPLADTVETSTSLNSTSILTNSTSTEISTTTTNSTDSTLDPLADTVETFTSLNSTSTDTSTNLTNSTDSTLDPLADTVETSTSLNSTSILTNSTSTEGVVAYSKLEKTIYHDDIEIDKNAVWHLDLSFDSVQNGIAVALPDDAQIKNISIDNSQITLFDSSQIGSLLATQDDVLENQVEGIGIFSPLAGESEILELDGLIFVTTSNDLYSLILLDDVPDLIQEGHEFNHIIIEAYSSDYTITFETPVVHTQEETTISDTEFNKNVTVSHESGLHYIDVRTCSDIPEEYVKLGVEFQLFWNIDDVDVDVTDDVRFDLSYEDSDGNEINDKMCWTVPQLSEQQFTIVANINVIDVQSYPTVGGYWTVRFDTLGTADLTITGFNGTTFGESLPDDLQFVELNNGTHNFVPEISGNSLIFRDYSSTTQGYEKSLVMTEGVHSLEFKFGTDIDYAYNNAHTIDASLLQIPGIIDDPAAEVPLCPTRVKIADLQTDYNPDTHILYASTQFTKDSSSNLSNIFVYLMDYTPTIPVEIAKSDYEVQAEDTNAHNDFQLPAAYTQSLPNARYVVEACYDTNGDLNTDNDVKSKTRGQAKLIVIEDIDRVAYEDVAESTAAGNDVTSDIASIITTDFAAAGNNVGAGTNVVLASVQLKNTIDTIEFPAGNLQLIRVGTNPGVNDVLIDKNFLQIDFGVHGSNPGQDESSGIQNFLLMGEDTSAPQVSEYKVTLSTDPVDGSVGATGANHNQGSTGHAVTAEVKFLVFQPSRVAYVVRDNISLDGNTANDIGDSFTTGIPSGTELVVIANTEFNDQSSGGEKLENLMLKQDGVIVSQSTNDDTDPDQVFDLRSQGGPNAPSNFGMTLLWKVEFAETPPEYQLSSTAASANNGLVGVSKIIAFTTVNEGRLPGVKITSFEGTDPAPAVNGYSDGDVLTLKFSEKTNRPPAGSKGEIDELFDFNIGITTQSIGNDYIGLWRSPTTLDITVLDVAGIAEATLNGKLTATIKASAKLRDAAQEKLISTDTSPPLDSAFGAVAGPVITTITASDPNDPPVAGFSNGDKITVRFGVPTNLAGFTLGATLDKGNIESLFTFIQNSLVVTLGEDYTGVWTNSKTLIITISDITDANPLLGAFEFVVNAAANLKQVDENGAEVSIASTDISPALLGTWGQRLGPEIIEFVASDPDGGDSAYGNDDVITAIFSEDTNMVPVGAINTVITKAQIDSLFTYVFDNGFESNPGDLGTDYSAIWVDAKTLKITIINSVADEGLPLPDIDKFKLTIKSDTYQLKDSAEETLSSTSTSVLVSGTFGATTGPKLTFIEAADSKTPTVGGFDASDTITVNFLEETDRPSAAKKAEIDSMFTFSEDIGDDYIGAWKNAKVFVITILKPGSDNPGIGTLTITTPANAGIEIRSKDGSSTPSESTSLVLIGSFGLKDGPLISLLTANDPNGITEGELGGYNNGDTIILRFSEPTNLASFTLDATLDKDNVNSMFRFTQEIGDDYTAVWTTDKTLVITIVDDTVDSPPEIGSLRLIVKESANLKDDDETSQASTSVSPTLIGTFGEKQGPTIISLTAADPFNATPNYGNRDTITVVFSETTNAPFFTNDETFLTKSQVDALFVFSVSLGDNYEGQWITPAEFLITVLDSTNNGNPQTNSFSLSLKLTASLKDESKSSLISTASSPVLSGTFGTLDAPVIFSIQASSGNIITMIFEDATNGVGNLSKSSLDELFDYKNNGVAAELGQSYIATWITPFELEIKILNIDTPNPPVVGEFQFIADDSITQILNSQETSKSLSGSSPILTGSFTQKVGPEILSITADDPSNQNDSYSVGDTITVVFSEPTNSPFYDSTLAENDPRVIAEDVVSLRPALIDEIDNEERTLTKDEVDSLFLFTQDLGDSYAGFWNNDSTFVITITDDAVDIPPEIGSMQIIVKESGNVLNFDSTSLPSISVSPTLVGSFGIFEDIVSIAKGAIGYTKLPSGLSSSIQLPESNSGTITFERITEIVDKRVGDVRQLIIGSSVDIDPTNGASCSDGCTVTFEFTTADALSMGLKPKNVKVLHDINGDGDFVDLVNIAPPGIFRNMVPETDHRTIITLIDDNGTPDDESDDRWRASGTSFSNSKFAVGGVKALALGAAFSSISNIQESKFVSLGNPDLGLGGSLHSIDLNIITEPMIFQTDETLIFRIGMYEQQGINFVQHAALYLNNIGDDLRSSDYDTSIVFDKYSEEPVKITDPNNILKHTKYQLLERDASSVIVQFSLTFAEPMDNSNLYFVSWNEDRNPTYRTYADVLTIKPLAAEYLDASPIVDVETYLEPTFDSTESELLLTDISIPYWVKPYAKLWSDGYVTDSEFILAIQYLLDTDTSLTSTSTIDTFNTDGIPNWVREYIRWWSEDKITNDDFISTINHLVKIGIIIN